MFSLGLFKHVFLSLSCSISHLKRIYLKEQKNRDEKKRNVEVRKRTPRKEMSENQDNDLLRMYMMLFKYHKR